MQMKDNIYANNQNLKLEIYIGFSETVSWLSNYSKLEDFEFKLDF